MASTARTDAPVCPTCGEAAAARGDRAFPFCSERCRLIDLGRWLDGDYRVPALDDAPSADDDEG
jgi:endogenous inhibitor of DNA gyrase (YacG/DUF329 family)